MGDLILQDDDPGAFVDGFVDIEVPIGLMAFEGDKDIARRHPAGMVGQSRDGNVCISPHIQDLQSLEKLAQIFPVR